MHLCCGQLRVDQGAAIVGVYNIQNPYRTQAAIYGDLREAAAEAKRVGITAFGDLHDQLRCVLHAVAGVHRQLCQV